MLQRPVADGEKDGAEGGAFFCELVGEAGGAGGGGDVADDAAGLETAEAVAEDIGGDALRGGGEVPEAGVAEEEIADDEEGPAIAKDIEGARDGAVGAARGGQGAGFLCGHGGVWRASACESKVFSIVFCKYGGRVALMSTIQESVIEPKLAPPGAGLPVVELMIGRMLATVGRRMGTRESFTAQFEGERGRVRGLIEGLSPEMGGRRVLIKRPAGMEDSSRYWSVWMTLDHLRIIHVAMARIIKGLGNGTPPPGQASTAAVKPSVDVDERVKGAYEASCDELLAAAAAVKNLETAARYEHPWFGPMDAKGWYGLAGTHLKIHRVQIERIIAAF